MKFKFSNLSIGSQIGILIGIATAIFWHFFLVFEFSEDLKQHINAFKNTTLTKIYQFRADNQNSMLSYDYERIRTNISNIDSQISFDFIKVTGNFDETIVSSGEPKNIDLLLTFNDGNEFIFGVSKNFNFYYFFNINFITSKDAKSDSKLTGIINLNSEIRKFVFILLFKYMVVLTLLLLQGCLIYLLGRKIALPITQISKEVSTDYKLHKIPVTLGENYEVQQFIKSYNNKISKEAELRDQLDEREKEIAIANAVGGLAKRLSHDIRSPLAALKVVRDMGASSLDPDQAKLLTMSIDRITDIANTILPKNSSHQTESNENAQSSFLWMLVDQIVSEKRVEYKNSNDVSIDFRFDSSPFDLNALCNATEFMRSISNIINNSIEAKDPAKKLNILVKLDLVKDQIALSITDNGKGMEPVILSKVFSEGFTYGKSQGTGLGLYQVKRATESWNGKISIESQPNVGTSITILLKQSPQPKWLISSINVSKYQSIIVLDDESYVFDILEDKFSSYQKPIKYFKRIDEFEKNNFNRTSLLFIDHDLKQNMSGIDLIQKHQLQDQSVLLTGNYDDKQVQQRASELGIKILPKPLINDILINS